MLPRSSNPGQAICSRPLKALSIPQWWHRLNQEPMHMQHNWQKLHSHAYTRAMVCSFASFTHYLIYLRRQSAKKIRLWRCLLHCSFPSHSW
jgi:ABC-type thiamine transport system substrate-binding protein